MNCEKCKNMIPDDAQVCHWCGEPVAKPAKAAPSVMESEIPRSAMAGEETYRGKYDSAPVPEKKETPKEPAEKPAKRMVKAKKCPLCGTVVPMDAASCTGCGAKFRVASEAPKAEEAPKAVEKKCADCGAPMRDGAKFCNICGATVASPKTEQKETPVAPEKEEPTACRCEACGATVKANARFCNICGAVLKCAGEPEKAPEKESAAPVVPVTAVQSSLIQKQGSPTQRSLTQNSLADKSPTQRSLAQESLTQNSLAQNSLTQKQEPDTVPCKTCGARVRKGAKFCNICGAVMTDPVQREMPKTISCPVCGAQTDAGAAICCNCKTVLDNSIADPVEPKKPKGAFREKRKGFLANKKFIGITLAVVAAIVVIILLGSIITSLMGLNGPFTKLASGTKALINAKSFTAEFELDGNGEKIQGTLEIQFDLKKQEVTMLIEGDYDGEKFLIAIYDEHLIQQYDDGEVYAQDISDELDDFFDNLEDAQDEVKDFDEIVELFVEGIMSDPDAEEIFDEDELEECLKTLLKKLNTPSWLKKNAGYSTKLQKGMTMHIFEPDVSDLVVAVLKELKPAFKDRDYYNDGMEEMEESLDQISDSVDIEFAFGLSFGRLKLITLDVNIDNVSRITGEIEFSKIGTTRIDTDELEDLLDEAE